MLLNLLLIYFLWSAVFTNRTVVLGYTQASMLTYVLFIQILSDVVFSTRIHEIGGMILTGDIIHIILKPFPFFTYLSIKELADKTINVASSIITVFVFALIVRPEWVFQLSVSNVFLFLYFLCVGIILAFFISFMMSLIAFWTPEIWAPRFIYFILVFILAGNYFPLDILPEKLFTLLLLTPFPYFIFFPLNVLQFGTAHVTFLSLYMPIVWGIVLFVLSKKLWNKGLKEYTFYGR